MQKAVISPSIGPVTAFCVSRTGEPKSAYLYRRKE